MEQTLSNTNAKRSRLIEDKCDVIGKGVLFKTFDVKVQAHSVPEL